MVASRLRRFSLQKPFMPDRRNVTGVTDPRMDTRPFYRKKRTYSLTFVFVGALFLFIQPQLLRRAGVIESDPVEDFIKRTLAALNDTYHYEEEWERPGHVLAKEGARAKHPIVVVPGFITSALEQWEGKECAKGRFRQRMFGGIAMARTIFTDQDCWIDHLSLDPFTGGDPPGVRIRPAQGFEAADYFMGGYWVWSKIIENLADVGYDGTLMTMATYDWRLAFPMMEERDGYFTKLKYTIESFHKVSKEKVVLMSHSMGGAVAFYFFVWVTRPEEQGGGGGGSDWVEKHVHSFVNIAGTLLGVPKAVPALVSGELKDTAIAGYLGDMLESIFGRRVRRQLWSTWGSLFAMLPKGGDEIWGVGADYCRGTSVKRLNCSEPLSGEEEEHSDRKGLVLFTETGCDETDALWNATCGPDTTNNNDKNGVCSVGYGPISERIRRHCLADASCSTERTINYLLKYGGGYGKDTASARLMSFDKHTLEQKAPREKWHNPAATALPHAPSLKIYCLYGTGIATERAYFYKSACDKPSAAANATEEVAHGVDPNVVIDTSIHHPESNISNGVKFSDGDGSVPLVSLGYMCEAWNKQNSRLNPSGIKVVTREYPNQAAFSITNPLARGGKKSGEHVDILGYHDVIEDVVKIATDFQATKVNRRIVSDLERITEHIESARKNPAKAHSARDTIWVGV